MTITSAEEFVRLRSSSDPSEYQRAAHDDAPAEVWKDVIARYPGYAKWVAHNKSIPEEVIVLLSGSSDPDVRHFIAAKRRTPPDVLVRFAGDADEAVRWRVVFNAKAPREALEVLAGDRVPEIRTKALERLQSDAHNGRLTA